MDRQDLCCLFCSLFSADIPAEFAQKLILGCRQVEDFSNCWKEREKEITSELTDDEKAKIELCAKVLTASGRNLLYHSAYYQKGTLNFYPPISCKLPDAGLRNGMIMQILRPKTDPGSVMANLLQKIIMESVTVDVRAEKCYPDLHGIPIEKTVIIKTTSSKNVAENIPIQNGIHYLSTEFSENIGYVTNENFTSTEEDLAELANCVRVVIIEDIKSVENLNKPARRDEPKLKDWLEMIKRCLGSYRDLIIIAVLDQRDFLGMAKSVNELFEVTERGINTDLTLYRAFLDDPNGDVSTWTVERSDRIKFQF